MAMNEGSEGLGFDLVYMVSWHLSRRTQENTKNNHHRKSGTGCEFRTSGILLRRVSGVPPVTVSALIYVRFVSV
jgi:hypothetical protein